MRQTSEPFSCYKGDRGAGVPLKSLLMGTLYYQFAAGTYQPTAKSTVEVYSNYKRDGGQNWEKCRNQRCFTSMGKPATAIIVNGDW